MTDDWNPILDAVRLRFVREGLLAPPVPLSLSADVSMYGAWDIGTAADTPALEAFQQHVDRLLRPDTPDYVRFGHAGHGSDSYAVYYYVRFRGLAVALELDWGGARSTTEEAAERVRRAFAAVEELIDLAESPLCSGHRVYASLSDRRGASFAGPSGRDGTLEAPRPADPDTVLAVALATLQRLSRPDR